MDGGRQKIQLELAFPTEGRGEAPRVVGEGTEASVADRKSENPVSTEQLMEEVCKRENLKKALKRVKSNGGSPGIDGMKVGDLSTYLKSHWPTYREQLLRETYRPQPVKRVEISKPDGGVRKLGIPTVMDRFIQQAMLQVLQSRWDYTFSAYSYGFRPLRSAHQAVTQAQQYITSGYNYVVDIDLEKFFDKVNHDRLMSTIAKRVEDKRMLKLIRAYLVAGVMENGLVSPTEKGTPQGGPLSPLLSNIVLDELDRELEARGHKFVRYADDCNIYVRTERAGHRVMRSITRFIEGKLKLKVNEAKSAVDRPWNRKFLGFSYTFGSEVKRRISPKALERFKVRVRELTRRSRGVSISQMVEQLSKYLQGWGNYYGYCQTPSVLEKLDSWIRRRLRCAYWKQWKRGRTRFKRLRSLGLNKDLAAKMAGSAKGLWRLSQSLALSIALPGAYFESLGLPRLAARVAT